MYVCTYVCMYVVGCWMLNVVSYLPIRWRKVELHIFISCAMGLLLVGLVPSLRLRPGTYHAIMISYRYWSIVQYIALGRYCGRLHCSIVGIVALYHCSITQPLPSQPACNQPSSPSFSLYLHTYIPTYGLYLHPMYIADTYCIVLYNTLPTIRPRHIWACMYAEDHYLAGGTSTSDVLGKAHFCLSALFFSHKVVTT